MTEQNERARDRGDNKAEEHHRHGAYVHVHDESFRR